MKTLTITEIAHAIATTNGWGDETRDKMHRQIRHWHKHNILHSFDGSLDGVFDRRGTARFEPYSVIKARVLLALSTLNLEIEDIKSALYGIEPPPDFIEESRDAAGRVVSTAKYYDADRELRHLRSVVRLIANGEIWFCSVGYWRDSTGQLIINARNEALSERELFDANCNEHQEECRISILLNDKIEPLLPFLRA